ncbi:hypothetical protein PanWU01x14_153720 [Parasponia andersonii]|uniref:Uncharacterized protein n=1 Tax=Parasponia andersonii TaxID=3476 RepID=A0A2P5CH59_PARAD|nr:hypothetical protein PanWU01x14_153720 [Parasponia andersonii]
MQVSWVIIVQFFRGQPVVVLEQLSCLARHYDHKLKPVFLKWSGDFILVSTLAFKDRKEKRTNSSKEQRSNRPFFNFCKLSEHGESLPEHILETVTQEITLNSVNTDNCRYLVVNTALYTCCFFTSSIVFSLISKAQNKHKKFQLKQRDLHFIIVSKISSPK